MKTALIIAAGWALASFIIGCGWHRLHQHFKRYDPFDPEHEEAMRKHMRAEVERIAAGRPPADLEDLIKATREHRHGCDPSMRCDREDWFVCKNHRASVAP